MRVSVSSLSAAVLVAAVVPIAAADPPGEPAGEGCAFVTAPDPRPGAPAGRTVAVLHGGPMAGEGTLVCTVVRNVNRHDAPDVLWSAEEASQGGVALLPPEVATWDLGAGDREYLCTSWRRPDGSTLYRDGTDAPPWHAATPAWTTNPAVPCSPDGSGPPPFGLVGHVIERLEAETCDALRSRHSGPYDPQQPYHVFVDDDGDVYVDDDGDGRIQDEEIQWDCTPYHTGNYSTWPDPTDPLA